MNERDHARADVGLIRTSWRRPPPLDGAGSATAGHEEERGRTLRAQNPPSTADSMERASNARRAMACGAHQPPREALRLLNKRRQTATARWRRLALWHRWRAARSACLRLLLRGGGGRGRGSGGDGRQLAAQSLHLSQQLLLLSRQLLRKAGGVVQLRLKALLVCTRGGRGAGDSGKL